MAGSLLGYDRLAETLEEIRAQVVALSTVPQLSRSSIEAGAILEFDADGNQVSQIGEQFDGAHAAVSLSGPKPPRPSAAGTSSTTPGTANVYWDGTYTDEGGTPDITIPVPTDYTSAEIHASQDPGFTAETWDTLTDAFTSPRGGMKTITLPAGTWYVKLVTRTLSGGRSDPSPAATVTVAAAITDADLTAMETRFDQDMATLSGNLTTLDNELTGAEGRIGTAEGNITSAFGRLDVVEPIASNAQSTANSAASTASAAQTAADAAAANVAAVIAAGQSVIPNGDFEAGDKYWSAASGRSIVTATGARSGSKVLRIDGPAMTANSFPMSEYVPSGNGRSFYIEYWIRRTGTDTANFVGIYTQTTTTAGGTSGIFLDRVTSANLPEGVWTKKSGTITIAVDGYRTRFGPHVTGGTANVYEIDDFLVVDVTEAVTAQARANEAHTLAGTAEGNAQSALTAAGTKTTVTYSTSAPAGNGAKIGDTHRQQVSTTDKNIKAEWYWTGSIWQAQAVTSEMVSNLDVGKLSAGTGSIIDLVAQRIAAASGQYIDLDVKQLNVTDSALIKTGVAESFFTKYFTTNRLSANQIYVGPGENLLADPKFLDDVMLTKRREASTGGTAGWAVIAGAGNDPRAVRKTTASSGEWWRFLPIAPTTANVNQYLSVEPGRRYKWTADVSTSTTANITWRVALANADGTITWVSYNPTGANSTGRRTLTLEWTCPANVVAIAPELYSTTAGTIWTVYGAAVIAPKTDGSLIVDGLINGQTVLGARIATADTGARIELNGTPGNNRLFGVNTSGVTYMNFTNTGAWLKAVLEIDAPLYSQIVKLGPQKLTSGQDVAGLGFYKTVEPVGNTPPLVTSTDGNSVRIEGRTTSTANAGFIEVLAGNQIQMFGNVAVQGNLNGIEDLEAYRLNVFTQIDSLTLVTGTSNIGYNGTGYYVRFASAFPGLFLRNDGTNGPEKASDAALWANGNNMLLRAPTTTSKGAVRIDSGTLLEYYDPPTSTFTANLGIASNPKDRVYKLGSSGDLKVNREQITDEHAWRILELVPRKWYDRAQLEDLLGPDAIDATDRLHPKVDPTLLAGLDIRMHPGLVAQEVHAAGLTEFVDYEDGQPAAVDYDRMWTLIIPILRYLLERVGYPANPRVPIKPSPLTRTQLPPRSTL